MELSIIIPTFNEQDNVGRMVERIEAVLAGVTDSYEIWFIDDSSDDTPRVLEQLDQGHQTVHYVHRDRGNGLAGAVVDGFHRTRGEFVVVMDADLQHPPELLPDILAKLRRGTDIVIPSRFIAGGSDGGLNPLRRLISYSARAIGWLMLKRLRRISDSTSGYFGLRRRVIEGATLNPIGWKILIEVLINGNYETVHEIPYKFSARGAGESKMNLREQFNYLRHLARLAMRSEEDRRFLLFCCVGALGVVVNILVLSLCLYTFRLDELLSSVLASTIAMIHNFLWNDRVTWRSISLRRGRMMYRLVIFVAISLISISITAGVMKGLRMLDVPVLFGQFAGIAIATLWSYTANNRLTWRDRGRVGARRVVVTRGNAGTDLA